MGSVSPNWNTDDDDAAPYGETTDANVSALDLVHLLREYSEMSCSHAYVATALWSLHTHVYNQFMVTPRLALVSPVRGCGKTTVLALLQFLTARGRKEDGITAAAIFRLVDREHCTLLLDEADNLGLDRDGILRSVLNSGHRRGGSLTRVIKDAPRRFSTFAPLAIAAIGTLPLPVMHRSLVIHMSRSTRNLRRFDETDPVVNAAYAMIRTWARDVQLQHDPELPTELRNRPADNWRVLIAVADSFGPAWGTRAREAAVDFSRAHRDEDAQVTLLNDICHVFNDLGANRLASKTLVAGLVEMDDALWADWRGLRDDQQLPPLVARRVGAIAGAIRYSATNDLATAAEPRNEECKRLHAIAIHEGVARVLRRCRHTGTNQQTQPLAPQLSRHKQPSSVSSADTLERVKPCGLRQSTL
jgi:hypothetical protein